MCCLFLIWRGTDKPLTPSNSRCRRAESIVSLERGVCSCAELQVFSFTEAESEACQATRAISTTSRRELSLNFFPAPARQCAEGNSRHSDRNIRGTLLHYARGKGWDMTCICSWKFSLKVLIKKRPHDGL